MKPTGRWGVLAFTLTPFGAWALGLGDIGLSSGLNQPLDAKIELVSATEDELTTLSVELASFGTFERYGLDRPAFLTEIVFQVSVDNFGRAVVSVSSQEPIVEPFITILVEATWARGRLLRGYTILLDPPVLLPASEPQVATAGYGPVQPSETLSSIASQSRPASVTLNQMMVAIYQANPQSFSGNMNTLHQGATLRIPQLGQLASVSANIESQEAARQGALSQGGGEGSSRLRLVTSESAVASGGSVAAATAADDATVAVAAELESELDSLRSEIESSQRLIEIRDQQLQDLRTQLAAAQALEASVDREFELLFADEAKQPTEMAPVVVLPAATTSVITPTVRPSLMPKILAWVLSPILLIGLGLITLTGTAVWYLRYREQTADDVTGRWEALEANLNGDDDTSSIALEGSIHAGGDNIVVDESPDADLEPFEVVALTEKSDLKVDVEIEAELEVTEGLSPSDSTMTIGIPPSEPSYDDAISSQTVILDTEDTTNLDIGTQKSTGYEMMSGRNNLLDPHTMTMMEVATKLDLARAYVDMGNSDDARSILEEVLEEGDDDQQMEANKIIDDI